MFNNRDIKQNGSGKSLTGSPNDKIAIVTGGNTGIGLWTTRKLVQEGYYVIMVCHNRQQGEATYNAIMKDLPAAKLTVEQLDLANLDSVVALGERIKKQYEHLSLLVNNAGINAANYCITHDGFESTLQVNYL